LQAVDTEVVVEAAATEEVVAATAMVVATGVKLRRWLVMPANHCLCCCVCVFRTRRKVPRGDGWMDVHPPLNEQGGGNSSLDYVSYHHIISSLHQSFIEKEEETILLGENYCYNTEEPASRLLRPDH
jgi:hypothetical protein